MEWKIKKIKNKNSNYDFRMISNTNNFSQINFFKCSYFRILVSLSSYLSEGVILCDSKQFQIKHDKNTPAIFNFSINNNSDKSQKSYLTLDNKLSKVIFYNDKKKIDIRLLSLPDTKVFFTLFQYEEVSNLSKFLNANSEAYKHINNTSVNLYLITGWINFDDGYNYLIMDLLKYDSRSRKTVLTRCKILDKTILKSLHKLKKNIKSYCLLLVEFVEETSIKIKYIIPTTMDEYITYLYDLMLPYKYDFNDLDKKDNKLQSIVYKDNDIERTAFAIDPDGSKDRDDAIASFFLKDNKITYDLKEATHIKLIVHISDTLPYISPKDNNYYYHYSKYKCNTDYLDKYNLPMMDRMLSEENLSLDGDNNSAITINLIYKIIDKEKFIIRPFPENVKIHRSKNLKIIGTTYKKFSESYNLKKMKGFDNSSFNERYIINCNKKLIRDYNEFIYEGNSMFPNKSKEHIANNLKQLYIFFVNSLNHTGKDTLIKIPSNLTREKHFDTCNIFLEFSPVDIWSHSLIEYTALESNIYFSYLMYLIAKNKIQPTNNIFSFDYKTIHDINDTVGSKNQKLLIDNITNDKVVKVSKCGIYRNLYTPGKIGSNLDFYINEEIKGMIVKMINSKDNIKDIIERFLEKFNYKVIKNNPNVTNFLKLILALRQTLLLFNAKSNLDISSRMISKEIKMKAKYDFFPFSHLDICSVFYTHATSPMRRFVDINVHNFIFDKECRDYIYANLDLDGINISVNTGKFIHQLVNNQRLIELIDINSQKKKLIMDAVLIDKKRNTIGLLEIVNFYSFNESFNLDENKTKVILNIDNYNLPNMKKANETDKNFNIFFHMLRKESEHIRAKCQKLLEKLFNLKKINKIC